MEPIENDLEPFDYLEEIVERVKARSKNKPLNKFLDILVQQEEKMRNLGYDLKIAVHWDAKDYTHLKKHPKNHQ